MTVLRPYNIEIPIEKYIATFGVFCVISCTIIMLRLRGFKASINILSGNRTSSEYYDTVPTVSSVTGEYRSRGQEFFGNGSLSDPPKKITPSMVKLPPSFQPDPTERQSKSTSDLTQVNNNLPPNLQKSTSVSLDPRGPSGNQTEPVKELNKNNLQKHEKEQRKLEQMRLKEQRKRDQLAAKLRAKEDKERMKREKFEANQRAKEAKRIEKENRSKNKGKDDKNKGKSLSNPLAQSTPVTNPLARVPPLPQSQPPTQEPSQYSTNTLDSSISKTSGPPPYSEVPKPVQRNISAEVVRNKSDDTGNTSFGRPVEASTSSWDMVSQHRQQMIRPTTTIGGGGGRPKQMVMDLQYNVGGPNNTSSEGKENSDA